HVKYNTLYFISIKCVLCEAIGSANKTLHTDYQYAQNLLDLSFFYEKKETKKPALCHLSKGGFCSRGSFKNQQGTGSIFQNAALKNLHLKPLSFLFCPLCFSYRKPYSAKSKFARLSVF